MSNGHRSIVEDLGFLRESYSIIQCSAHPDQNDPPPCVYLTLNLHFSTQIIHLCVYLFPKRKLPFQEEEDRPQHDTRPPGPVPLAPPRFEPFITRYPTDSSDPLKAATQVRGGPHGVTMRTWEVGKLRWLNDVECEFPESLETKAPAVGA